MPKVLVESVAKTLKKLRTDKHLSQESLAAQAELDRTYISGVERGVRNITLDSLESIINALGVDVSTFLNELEKTLKE